MNLIKSVTLVITGAVMLTCNSITVSRSMNESSSGAELQALADKINTVYGNGVQYDKMVNIWDYNEMRLGGKRIYDLRPGDELFGIKKAEVTDGQLHLWLDGSRPECKNPVVVQGAVAGRSIVEPKRIVIIGTGVKWGSHAYEAKKAAAMFAAPTD